MDRAASSSYRPLTPRAQEALALEVPAIAAALLRLREAMDEEANDCKCCGLPVRRSFTDSQVAEQIGGMLGKLKRWVGMAEQDARCGDVARHV